jgi:succinate dehydrogenase/fumarate reductase flavoprotein subunit
VLFSLRAFASLRWNFPVGMKQFDYLVLGSGIAGLSFALKVAPCGRVAIVTIFSYFTGIMSGMACRSNRR